MKIYFSVIILAACCLLLAACSPTISSRGKYAIDKPINCGTASRDIRMLEEEKASLGKQVISGVRMVLPVAAVVGILSGDYGNRAKVTTGKYNRDIEAKIAEIKEACYTL